MRERSARPTNVTRLQGACSFVFLGVSSTFGFYSVSIPLHPMAHPTMSKPRSRMYGVPTHPTVRGWEHRGTTVTRQRGSRQALCAWLPTFELRLELVRTPELDSTSVALLSPGENTRRTIWQVSERASIAGVRPGQLISQAIALCPSLTLLEPDPAHYDATQ